MLEAEITQTWVFVRPASKRPVVLAIRCQNGKVVDGCKSRRHKAIVRSLFQSLSKTARAMHVKYRVGLSVRVPKRTSSPCSHQDSQDRLSDNIWKHAFRRHEVFEVKTKPSRDPFKTRPSS
jgi:hypothetical protein